jgi:4-amino-4-deoxy-L-arabinose transferase-like glycosyltransferase
LGVNVWALRITSVAAGIAAILLTYLLGKALFNWRVGLAGALLLAVSHHAIALSRLGIVNMQMVPMELLSFLLVWLGFRNGRPLLVALGGAVAGLGLYLYFASLVVPVILAVLVIYLAVRHRDRIGGYWRTAVLGIGAMVVVATPWLWAVARSPEVVTGRTGEVSILRDMDAFKRRWNTDSTLEVLRQQSKHTAQFFTTGRDTSTQYGYDAPFFDRRVIRWLFFIGLAVAALLVWRPEGALLLLWLGLTLAFGGVLTDSPPFSPRLVGVFPVATLLAGLGLVAPLDALGRLARLPLLRNALALTTLLLIVAVGAFATRWNFRAYFQEYPNTPHAIYWPWIEPNSSLGRHLAAQPGPATVYLFRTPHVYASQPPMRFYLYGKPVAVHDVKCAPKEPRPPEPGRGEVVYVFLPETMRWLGPVQRATGGGELARIRGHYDPGGAIAEQFVSLRVPASQAVNPHGVCLPSPTPGG